MDFLRADQISSKQVEDTLNNSNDLFLTFRKEMEEMAKKTKRLEKENIQLTKKHDLTNRNILEMAEERTKSNKEMENLRKRNDVLEKLARGIQAQERSTAGLEAALANQDEDTMSEGQSDYPDEDEDEEGDFDSEEDYDEETEDEAQPAQGGPAVYGPPLPNTGPATRVNGGGIHRYINGEVNGVKPSVVS